MSICFRDRGGTPLTAQLKRLAFPFLSAGWWGGEDKDYCAKFTIVS